MRIDVDAICRHVLAQKPTEGELEVQLRAVCRKLYGDGQEAAVRAVLNVLDSHAERQGRSRLASLTELTGGQAELNVTRQVWTSLDEVPPELREKFQELMRSGQGGPVSGGRIIRWDASGGPPDAEMATAIGRALGRDDIRPGQPIVVRRTFRVRGIIVFLVVLFAVVAVQLTGVLLEARRPSGRLGVLIEQIERLEKQRAEAPHDADIALDLATAYARKMLTIQSVAGLQKTLPLARAEESKAAEQRQEAERGLARAIALTGGPEEADALMQKGEALTVQVLSLNDLTGQEVVETYVLLGHFLLAQGRTNEARQATAQAGLLAPGHVGTHLLNALICERAGDYDGAIRENRRAASRLNAWAADGLAMRRYVAWGIGPEPVADADEWPEHADKAAAGLHASLELHTVALRAGAGVREPLTGPGDMAGR